MLLMARRATGRIARLFDAEIQRLAADSLWLTLGAASKTVIGILQVTVVTRFLGREAYGQLALIISVPVIVSLVLSARVWEWVTKLFTEAHTAKDARTAGAVMRLGLTISALANVAALSVVLASSGFYARAILHQPRLAPLISLFATTLLSTWAGESCAAVLRVAGRFRFLAFYGIGTTALRFLLLLFPLLLGYGLEGVIYGYIAAEMLINLSLYLATNMQFRADFGDSWWKQPLNVLALRKQEMVQMLAFSFGIDTLRSFGSQADVFLLGALRSPTEVAFFKVAQAAVDVINRLMGSVLMAAYPALARLAAVGDVDAMLRLVRRSSAVITLVTIPGCALTMTLAPWIVRLVAGPDFQGAVPVLRILAWSLLWMITFWVIPVCVSIGKSRWAFVFTAAMLIAKLAFEVPLTAVHGEIGMAIALVVAHCAFIGGSLFMLKRVARFMRSSDFRATVGGAARS